ncbi:MAG: ATP-binding protein [Sumerlaeia bacterium]
MIDSSYPELIYTLTVPCVPDSLAVLEVLCENYIYSSHKITEQAALVVRLAVAEACRNALSQRSSNGGLSVASLTFLREGTKKSEQDLDNLVLEIKDPGPGLQVAGKYPPYAEEMHDQLYVLQEILGQTLIARVDSAHDVTILCLDEAESAGLTRRERIDKMNDHGLGLLALTRTWNRVTFHFSTEGGNTVRLKKPILINP